MSLKTWKTEFYPKPPSKRMSKKAAIEHSLQKWIGLRKSNLKKHGVEKFSFKIMDYNVNSLVVDADSCALCKKYLDTDRWDYDDKLGLCKECPLAQSLGNPCDGVGAGNRPYSKWLETGNPAPMIKALKALLEEK